MYLYSTSVITNISAYQGLTSAQITQNNTDKTDFETNFKSQAVKVDEIVPIETVFIISKTYTEFKALIINPINWSDVKYIQGANKYYLFLLT